ncbi:MAG TPA: tetratricopeptide repeat protein, partial [Herpetosiphonaceae bacterium]
MEQCATNLPAALNSFVGRERELAEIQRLILAQRLLTLTGIGGCGKTRLALESAAQVAPIFGGRVWFVDFSALVEPDLVPRAVATALSICEESGIPLLTTLITTLAPYQTLLVLDNCEHLVAACAALTQSLLHSCPALRVLTTSRETLDIIGECVCPVPSLTFPVPPAPHDQPLQECDLLGFEAVRLFVERAQAASPTFSTDPAVLTVIGEICRSLDGIPLAIELAAARTRTVSVQQIAARLDDSMVLLTSRYRTMEATLDWSYGLLSEQERTILRRLSVFAGGWSLAAAESVCTDDTIPAHIVLDLLSGLVQKSLVVRVALPGEGRYRLLELVRQYAHKQLMTTDEQAGIQDRHLAYFAGRITCASKHLTSADQGMWFERLELEFDNLRAALDRAIVVAGATGQTDAIIQALALPADLERFWSVRGYIAEGAERLRRALALAGTQAPHVALARAYALNAAGIVAWLQGSYQESQHLLEEALAIGETTQDRRTMLGALRNLGTLAVLRRDLVAGEALLERGLACEREMGGVDRYSVAWMVTLLGSAAYLQGDNKRAQTCFEESIALLRAVGDTNFLALSLRRLGQIALHSGASRRARTLLCESLDLNSQIGSPGGIAACIAGLAGVLLAQGQPADAARLLGSARSLLKETAAHLMAADREMLDTLLVRTRAWLGNGFDQAWAEGYATQGNAAALAMVSRVLSASERSSAPELTASVPARIHADTLTAREREVAALV